MATAKITRFSLPKAKLLQFNHQGKSIPATAPIVDDVDREFACVRELLSESQWAVVKPYAERVMRQRG